MSYPEHEKLAAVKDRSQTIGEFLDWYQSEGGGVLAHWLKAATCYVCYGEPGVVEECDNCGGDGAVKLEHARLSFDGRSIEKLLAAFFGIDLDKIAEEKDAMYQEIRSRQTQLTTTT